MPPARGSCPPARTACRRATRSSPDGHLPAWSRPRAPRRPARRSEAILQGQRALGGAPRSLPRVLGGAGADGVAHRRRRAAAARGAADRSLRVPPVGRLLGGDRRELGERVPPDGGVRPAHRVPEPEGLAGVEATRRRPGRRPRRRRRGRTRRGRCGAAGVVAAALRELALHRARRAVPRVVRDARARRRARLQRGAGARTAGAR